MLGAGSLGRTLTVPTSFVVVYLAGARRGVQQRAVGADVRTHAALPHLVEHLDGRVEVAVVPAGGDERVEGDDVRLRHRLKHRKRQVQQVLPPYTPYTPYTPYIGNAASACR